MERIALGIKLGNMANLDMVESEETKQGALGRLQHNGALGNYIALRNLVMKKREFEVGGYPILVLRCS